MNGKQESIPFWFKGNDNMVSLYSSVRISRNYKGINFPSSPGYGSFRDIEKTTDDILSECIHSGRITKTSLTAVSQDQILRYKKLRLLPEKRNAVLSRLSIYHDSKTGAWLITNYNDHLTFFAHSQGIKLKKAFSDCNSFADMFDRSLFSSDDNGNYHTSALGYFGSGLKCFSVLTLPALGVTEGTDSIIPSICHNGYAVRNYFGRSPGSLLIISNRDSYSKKAGVILDDFIKLLDELKIKMLTIENGSSDLTYELTGKCNEIINYESLTFDDFMKIYYILSFLRLKGKIRIGIPRLNEFLLRSILDSPGVNPGTVLRRSLKEDIAVSIKKYLK